MFVSLPCQKRKANEKEIAGLLHFVAKYVEGLKYTKYRITDVSETENERNE